MVPDNSFKLKPLHDSTKEQSANKNMGPTAQVHNRSFDSVE